MSCHVQYTCPKLTQKRAGDLLAACVIISNPLNLVWPSARAGWSLISGAQARPAEGVGVLAAAHLQRAGRSVQGAANPEPWW